MAADHRFTRRQLTQALGAALAGAPAVMARSDAGAIRVEQITLTYADFKYRAPYKFGGRSVDKVTLINVSCTVRTRAGKTAVGFGSMPLGNVWAFPSPRLSYDETLGAMKALASKIEHVTGRYQEYGHAIDINAALEPAYLEAAKATAAELKLGEPIPKLCTLVTASAFDAAIHDAFGKIHGRSTYATYGPDLLPNDLSRYLGADFTGLWLNQFVHSQCAPRMPVFHSVGALDALTEAEITHPIGDGLPESLAAWIPYDGITHIKIKLNGDDLGWDLDRVRGIHRVASEAEAKRGIREWSYSLDFNEKCRTVDYLLAFIHGLKEKTPGAFERILYVEQPTARDLASDRKNVMFEASKLVPVVIDESLTGLDALMLARDMGYTGVALKACKGQTQAMLMAAAGQRMKMFLCVQDLTCPGASLIQSAGIAAHVPGIAGIEANAREYVPAANAEWVDRFPGIFRLTNGEMKTGSLTGPGLGAV